MSFFSSLRVTPFEPTFKWVNTIEEAADRINKPHEDYPNRVVATKSQLSLMMDYFKETENKIVYDVLPITNQVLNSIHKIIFPDLSKSGEFREKNVIVGVHYPPKYEDIEKLMNQFELIYEDKEITIEMLIDWYTDFETIHPYIDGNGRVGGVIVASYSHQLHPEKGWMAPNQ